jgi:hypothetical protein
MKQSRDKIEVIMDELAEMQKLSEMGYNGHKGIAEFLTKKDYLDLVGGIVVALDLNQNIVFINKKGRAILECKAGDSYTRKKLV